MSVLGSVQVVSDKDVKTGEKATIASMFSIAERSKEYQLGENIIEGKPIKVSIDKFVPFDTVADATIDADQKVTCWRLVTYVDFNERELVASEDVQKGDSLTVTYEKA